LRLQSLHPAPGAIVGLPHSGDASEPGGDPIAPVERIAQILFDG
jgi:hypothetical protein